MSGVLAPTKAILLGGALLAGMAAMLGFSAFEQTRRTSLERFDEPTAVGDTVFFSTTMPPALALVSDRQLTLHDTRMRRTSRDAATGLSLYRYEGALPKDDEHAHSTEQFFYLKTGPETYVRVRGGSGGK